MRWTRPKWGSVLFSHEPKLNVSFAASRLGVWRRNGEHFDDSCVDEHDTGAGGSVLVWGGITAFQKSQLVVLNGHVNA